MINHDAAVAWLCIFMTHLEWEARKLQTLKWPQNGGGQRDQFEATWSVRPLTVYTDNFT